MNYNHAKRSFVGLAVGFFIVSTMLVVSCAPKRVKVVYENSNDSGYSKINHKHKHKKMRHRRMHLLMDIGRNTIIDIIHPVLSTTTMVGSFISI